MSLALRNKPRKPHSKETKEKIGAAHKGKIVSQESRQKLSHSRKFKTGTPGWNDRPACKEETKEKISKALQGRVPWNKGRRKLT